MNRLMAVVTFTLESVADYAKSIAVGMMGLMMLWAGASNGAEIHIENIRFDCVIVPYEVVNLASSAEGVLVEVNVDRGDRVREGQLLARIDSRVEEAEAELARIRAASTASIDASRARLAFQNARLKRNRDLAGQDMISKENLEEIETEVELAEQELHQANVDKRLENLELARALNLLELRQIVSPFDGVVMEKLLSDGEYVDGTAVLRVARMDPLRVEVSLPVSLYSGVVPGMRAEIFPKETAFGVHAATVADRDTVLDANGSTFRVRLELANPDYRLAAGVRCQVRFLPK